MTTCNNNYVSYQWGINHIISTQSIEHIDETGRCLLARQQVTTSWSTEAPAWCRSDADHLQKCVHLCVVITQHFCSYLQSVYWSLLQFLTFPLVSACFHISIFLAWWDTVSCENHIREPSFISPWFWNHMFLVPSLLLLPQCFWTKTFLGSF